MTKKILVVDDEKIVCDMARIILQNEGPDTLQVGLADRHRGIVAFVFHGVVGAAKIQRHRRADHVHGVARDVPAVALGMPGRS